MFTLLPIINFTLVSRFIASSNVPLSRYLRRKSLIDSISATVYSLNQRPFASETMLALFEKHEHELREMKKQKMAAYQVRPVHIADAADNCGDCEDGGGQDTIGSAHPEDKYEGDNHLRTLRRLLAIIDDRGFQRSPHQLRFHQSFESAISRVLFKNDWAVSKPDIVKRVGWPKTPSEILISTPRRFGKTFA